MSARFSVVIPCRDDSENLPKAVDSVLASTTEDVEVIVVDDGSDPPLPSDQDDRVIFIRHETALGPAAARNTGMSLATGEYLAFCDSDDIYSAGRLDLASQLHRASDVVVVGQSSLHSAITSGWMPSSLSQVADRTTPHLGCTSIRRELAPRMDVRYLGAEDIEWWIRVIATDASFSSNSRVGYLYRQSDHARVLNSQSARLRFSYQLFEDHPEFFATHRRAAAFRWYRIMMMETRIGNGTRARLALRRSIVSCPSLRAIRQLPTVILLSRRNLTS